MNFESIGQNIPVIITIFTAIGSLIGFLTNIVFTKLRKRSEEVNVTGQEHDTVKRISQSSIENVERLMEFSEQLSNKVLMQREQFIETIEKLEGEIQRLREINKQLKVYNDSLLEEITLLKETNSDLIAQIKILKNGTGTNE